MGKRNQTSRLGSPDRKRGGDGRGRTRSRTFTVDTPHPTPTPTCSRSRRARHTRTYHTCHHLHHAPCSQVPCTTHREMHEREHTRTRPSPLRHAPPPPPPPQYCERVHQLAQSLAHGSNYIRARGRHDRGVPIEWVFRGKWREGDRRRGRRRIRRGNG